MAKRAMIVVACLVLAGVCYLLLWQRSVDAQSVPARPAAQDNPRGMPLGAECSVYLRGDATGMSVHDRVVDPSSLVKLDGKMEAGGDHWIVLTTDQGKREWIPVPSVAAVVADK